MEMGVSLGSVPVHRRIVDPCHPCALRMHNADTSDVLNSNNAAVSAFLHVPWNKGLEADMSACVGWGLDLRLCIKRYVRVLYGTCVLNANSAAVCSTLLLLLCSAAVFATPVKATQRIRYHHHHSVLIVAE